MIDGIFVFACVFFSAGILLVIFVPFFHYFCTKKIIFLLTEARFSELANQFQIVVCTIGLLRPWGFDKDGKAWDKVWSDFRKTIISNKHKILRRYQLAEKCMHYFIIIYITIFFAIPVCFIAWGVIILIV